VDFISKIKQLDKKQALALLIAFGVAIFLDFAFVLKAQSKAAARAAKKISELKNNIKDIETKSKEIAAIQQGKNANLAKPKRMKPASELPLLLQEISDMAKESEVKVNQIVHIKGIKPKDKNYLPITIKLSLNCGYHNLGTFINSLEDAQQLIFAEEITIARDARDVQKEKVELVLKTYVK
jgi:Tfp pilus assembly protein PilO